MVVLNLESLHQFDGRLGCVCDHVSDVVYLCLLPYRSFRPDTNGPSRQGGHWFDLLTHNKILLLLLNNAGLALPIMVTRPHLMQQQQQNYHWNAITSKTCYLVKKHRLSLFSRSNKSDPCV